MPRKQTSHDFSVFFPYLFSFFSSFSPKVHHLLVAFIPFFIMKKIQMREGNVHKVFSLGDAHADAPPSPLGRKEENEPSPMKKEDISSLPTRMSVPSKSGPSLRGSSNTSSENPSFLSSAKVPLNPLDENQVRLLRKLATHQKKDSLKESLGTAKPSFSSQDQAFEKIASHKLKDQLAQLEQATQALQSNKVHFAKQEVENIQHMVKILENMKPKVVAELFNKMNADVISILFRHMNEKKSAAILAEMDPSKARSLTLVFLSKKAS